MDKTHIVRVHHPSGQLYEAWCDFVGHHPDGTFFQSDVVLRHADTWPDAEMVLLLLLDSSHKLHGSLLAIVTGGSAGLLARFTRTTLVYGGPVLAARRRLQEHMNLDALLKALISEVKHRSASIRFVNMSDWSDHQPVFNANGFTWSDSNSLLLRLPNKTKAWGALSEECREHISSSFDKGAVSFDTVSSQQLQDFYALLQRSSSKRARKALPPLPFFEALAREWGCYGETKGLDLSAKDHRLENDWSTETGLDLSAYDRRPENECTTGQGFFVLVQYQGRIVGGAVCPVVSGRLMQVWLLAGLDQQYGKYGVYPGTLSLWAAMENAMTHRIPYVSVLERAVLFPGGLKGLQPLFGGDLLNYGRFVRRNLWRLR